MFPRSPDIFGCGAFLFLHPGGSITHSRTLLPLSPRSLIRILWIPRIIARVRSTLFNVYLYFINSGRDAVWVPNPVLLLPSQKLRFYLCLWDVLSCCEGWKEERSAAAAYMGRRADAGGASEGSRRKPSVEIPFLSREEVCTSPYGRPQAIQLTYSPLLCLPRSAKRKISAQFKPAEEEIPLDDRLARETRLYKEARERLKRGKPLRFVPDYDHLTRAHRQLSGSLQFFHIGIHWMGMPRWRKPYLDFEWAPPPPTSLPSTKTVECVSGLDARVMIEMPRTPELMRADSDRPSIADSEATLVADTPMDTGDDELCKGPPESSRSARSFSLIQSFYSFISDPGNPLASF